MLVSPEVANHPRHSRTHLPVLVVHVVAYAQRLQEHQPQQHAHIALELEVVGLVLLADPVEGLHALYEGSDEFVVDEVDFPGLAVGCVLVVVVVEHLLVGEVDSQPLADPAVHLVGGELVLDDECAQLVFVHKLCLLVDVDCLALDGHQVLLVLLNDSFLDLVLAHELAVAYVLVLPQRPHVVVDRLEGKQVRSAQLYLQDRFVPLRVVFKNLLTGLDYYHDVRFVLVEEHSGVEFAFDDQFVEQAEAKQSGHVVRATFRVDPDHVFLDYGLLEVLAPEQVAFAEVLESGSTLVLRLLRALAFVLALTFVLALAFLVALPAVLTLFLLVPEPLVLLLPEPLLLLVLVLLDVLEASDLVKDLLDAVGEGAQEFGYAFDPAEDDLALFCFGVVLHVPQQLGVEVEVDYVFEVYPDEVVVVFCGHPVAEAAEFAELLRKHLPDDGLVLFLEVLRLPQLDVLLYVQALHHFVVLVDLEEGVSRRVLGVEAALILEEEEGEEEGDVLLLGLQLAAGLQVKQIVEELECLADCYLLVL